MKQDDFPFTVKGRRFDEDGRFYPDPRSVSPPVGYRKQPSMVDVVRDMVRSEKLRQEAEAAGADTFEEADDFDVGDDYDPRSPYELCFDPPLPPYGSPEVPLEAGDAPGGGSPPASKGDPAEEDPAPPEEAPVPPPAKPKPAPKPKPPAM